MKKVEKTDIYQNYWNEKIIEKGEYPDYLTDAGRHHMFKTLTSIFAHLPFDKKVLDIGCGSGFSTSFYYPYCKELSGVDYAREAIKKAKQKYPHINFKEANMAQLPFKDNEFDIVICKGVLHHLIRDTITHYSEANYVFKTLYEIDRVGKGLILVDEANALNPLRKYKEKKYYPKINRNEDSYTLRTWKNIFRELGYKITYYEYHTFIPLGFSRRMIKLFKPVEDILEITPLLNKFGGGIFFTCEKDE